VSDTVRCGVDWDLEEQADRILADSRRGVTKLSEKKDILTNEQLNLRRSREVYNHVGTPEPHIVSGLYRRAYNPRAHDRPTKLRSSE
jgi:hypothetical protein